MNGLGQPKSANFYFLAKRFPDLERIGALSEHYFTSDPIVALITIRQFGELLAQIVAAKSGLLPDPQDTQADLLRRLRVEGSYPGNVLELFHQLRMAGNAATHRREGDYATALANLKMARQLAIWFHRTFQDSKFKAGPFQPPRPPTDPTIEVAAELARLKAERDAALSEAERAKTAAAEAEAARLAAEQGAHGAAEERKVWEELASEAEAAKAELTKQLAILQATAGAEAFSLERRDAFRLEKGVERLRSPRLPSPAILSARDLAENMVEWQAASAASSTAVKQDTLRLAEAAAQAIDLDEADTRVLVDEQLREVGWEADTINLRYSKGVRPARGRSLAIAEWPTKKGPADYALFVGLTLVGMVEAKRKSKNVSAAIDQAERYSNGVQATDDFQFAGGPWGTHKVPFVFATNGRPYLKQLVTESGIWFRDTRRAANHRRALVSWPTPEGLTEQLDVNQDAATDALKEMPFEFGFPLRDYQKGAIKAVEHALATDRRSMLMAMATGTGKTKLAIAMLYRLLATKRFRRICFVVDRSALGEQAAGEFTTTKIVSGKAFADIFGLKKLADISPETETKVHICTIQGLVKRVLYATDRSETPPVDQYDLMVIDECHRGYLLDREMSDAELSF
ncbi:DEAD/DEAH box helicase family protein [Bradyrhizobium sp. UFLA05-153]